MITERDIEHSFDWLNKNAEPAAKARADRLYLEEFRKTLKAEIMAEHANLKIGEQEREAYADSRYKAHLLGYQEAVKRDEWFRWWKGAHEAKIEAWRTMESSRRGMGKVG